MDTIGQLMDAILSLLMKKENKIKSNESSDGQYSPVPLIGTGFFLFSANNLVYLLRNRELSEIKIAGWSLWNKKRMG